MTLIVQNVVSVLLYVKKKQLFRHQENFLSYHALRKDNKRASISNTCSFYLIIFNINITIISLGSNLLRTMTNLN